MALRALGPAPYLRRDFTVDGPVAWARLYVTALGLYEARLNGHRVGDAVLAPGWTDYAQRIGYQTYDVTALIQPGGNVLGALLADGWYAGFFGFDAKRAGAHYGTAPELLAQLAITFDDGSLAADRHRRPVAGRVRRDPARGPADGRAARPVARAARLGRSRLRSLRLARRAGHWCLRPRTVDAAGRRPAVSPIRVTEEIAAYKRLTRGRGGRRAYRRLRAEPHRLQGAGCEGRRARRANDP